MNKNNIISCYIMGQDTITLQCAEIILAKNHHILGIISDSKPIKEWCSAHTIPYIKNLKEFEAHCNDIPFDFLFSIANGFVLSQDILQRPRFCAINYHNSPLPKYAGLYATSWAILNREVKHAITWHVMNEVVDAGHILKQPFFSITEEDTALSLNLKCFEHAIDSFRQLIDELATHTITPIKQNLSQRSYYGLKNKPKQLGFIAWEQSAEDIDILCRALTLGNYTNQLATPKILINGSIFIIKSYKTSNVSSGLKPGSIVKFNNGHLQIATSTNDIVILELTDINGTQTSINSLVQLYGLNNMRFESISETVVEKLLSSPANIPIKEKFWVKEFLNCTEDVDFLSKLSSLKNKSLLIRQKTPLPALLVKQLLAIFKDSITLKDILLTAILGYLYRLNNYKNLSVSFSYEELSSSELSIFLSDYVPLTTHFKSNLTFKEAVQLISENCIRLYENKTFAKDLFIRYPDIKKYAQPMSVNISFVDPMKPIIYQNDKKLMIYLASDGTQFEIQYPANCSSLSQSHAFLEQMNNHLINLLSDIIQNPDNKLFELSYLGEEEYHKQLVEWNDTYKDFENNKLLHQYFEEQALKTPNAIAAVFEKKSITYQTLNEKANQLADFLKMNHDIQPNHIIGIALNRSLEMIIGILGILKSGAAYLPLDPNYPDERISYMLNDSQALLLLMDRHSIQKTPQTYDGPTIDIYAIFNQKHLSKENQQPQSQATNLAYVIYTSGTTGNPKGVAISNHAICNHMLWMKDTYSFQKKDIFLQKTPFSFDASVWEFFMPLMVGGKLVIAPNNSHTNPEEMINLIHENQISVLQLVPSMLKRLVTTKGYDSCHSLKQIFCGGEALTSETIHTFFNNNFSHALLHNLYGPTETTIDAVTTTCREQEESKDISVIGKPIANTQVYVLDKHMRLVPIGIIGELHISGEGLANGYLHNPQMTQKKFVANPFGDSSKNRLYKTGDLVKWNSKGVLEYHGRSDNQVKIRGFRIELHEIEFFLEKVPFIHQCLVMPECNDGLLSLSAYIVLEKEANINLSHIRLALKNSLPEHMLPSRFFVVDQFLLAPGGKIDRKTLPAPIKQLSLGGKPKEPNTKIEKSLKELWCSTLKMHDIGIDDNFFDLGGNSLLAMTILSLIKNQFSVSLSIRVFFDHPTIHTLGKEIEKNQSAKIERDNSNIVMIKENGSSTPIFLVHPIGGSVFWYKQLGQYIDKEHPLYAIQDPGLDQNEFLFESLEEMAAFYVQAIKTIQPDGPYLLGGASFGTTIAIEMAKQLQEQDETIIAILSLDGWAFYPSLQNDEAYFQHVMKGQNERLLKNYLNHNIHNAQFLLKLQWHREQMLNKYKLPIIQTRFVLFKANELTEMFPYTADLNWWDNYTTNPISLYTVPGNHESMFSEHNVKFLASKINEAINTNPIRSKIYNNENEEALFI